MDNMADILSLSYFMLFCGNMLPWKLGIHRPEDGERPILKPINLNFLCIEGILTNDGNNNKINKKHKYEAQDLQCVRVITFSYWY